MGWHCFTGFKDSFIGYNGWNDQLHKNIKVGGQKLILRNEMTIHPNLKGVFRILAYKNCGIWAWWHLLISICFGKKLSMWIGENKMAIVIDPYEN